MIVCIHYTAQHAAVTVSSSAHSAAGVGDGFDTYRQLDSLFNVSTVLVARLTALYLHSILVLVARTLQILHRSGNVSHRAELSAHNKTTCVLAGYKTLLAGLSGYPARKPTNHYGGNMLFVPAGRQIEGTVGHLSAALQPLLNVFA